MNNKSKHKSDGSTQKELLRHYFAHIGNSIRKIDDPPTPTAGCSLIQI